MGLIMWLCEYVCTHTHTHTDTTHTHTHTLTHMHAHAHTPSQTILLDLHTAHTHTTLGSHGQTSPMPFFTVCAFVFGGKKKSLFKFVSNLLLEFYPLVTVWVLFCLHRMLSVYLMSLYFPRIDHLSEFLPSSESPVLSFFCTWVLTPL